MNIEFDFEYAINKKEIDLKLEGWKPIVVEYGLYQISRKTYLLWRIKNSEHTFNIPLDIIIKYHGGNYKEHFEKALKKFRTDLLGWVNDGLPEKWMEKYYSEFFDLIS